MTRIEEAPGRTATGGGRRLTLRPCGAMGIRPSNYQSCARRIIWTTYVGRATLIAVLEGP